MLGRGIVAALWPLWRAIAGTVQGQQQVYLPRSWSSRQLPAVEPSVHECTSAWRPACLAAGEHARGGVPRRHARDCAQGLWPRGALHRLHGGCSGGWRPWGRGGAGRRCGPLGRRQRRCPRVPAGVKRALRGGYPVLTGAAPAPGLPSPPAGDRREDGGLPPRRPPAGARAGGAAGGRQEPALARGSACGAPAALTPNAAPCCLRSLCLRGRWRWR